MKPAAALKTRLTHLIARLTQLPSFPLNLSLQVLLACAAAKRELEVRATDYMQGWVAEEHVRASVLHWEETIDKTEEACMRGVAGGWSVRWDPGTESYFFEKDGTVSKSLAVSVVK